MFVDETNYIDETDIHVFMIFNNFVFPSLLMNIVFTQT